MKRTTILPALITAFVALSPAGVALADNPHSPGATGQPNQSAEDQPSAPAGFSSGGFANAEQHYAGTQPQNSRNAHSVSQYDVAAFQVSHKGP
jgi:hypothetical protein